MGGASLIRAVIEALSAEGTTAGAVEKALAVIAQSLGVRDALIYTEAQRLWPQAKIFSGTGQGDAAALRQRIGRAPTDGLLGSATDPVLVMHLDHAGRRLATLVLCADDMAARNIDQLRGELASVRQLLAIALSHGSMVERLSSSERLYRELVNGAKSIILRYDAKGTIRFINEYGARFFGYGVEALVGRDVIATIMQDQDEVPKSESRSPASRMAQVRANPELRLPSEMSHRRADGSKVWVAWSNHPILDRRGYLLEVLSVGQNISRRKELEAELRHLATTDALTGAANRRELFTLLEGEARRAERHQRPLSLLMIDVDFFKRVNDAHGHDVGDKVLAAFVAICEREVRDTDSVGRLGGEEFAIILPETAREAAVHVAERLRRAVASDSALPVPITISTGVAQLAPGESVASFYKRADDALYRAKGAGRDRVVFAELFVEGGAAPLSEGAGEDQTGPPR